MILCVEVQLLLVNCHVLTKTQRDNFLTLADMFRCSWKISDNKAAETCLITCWWWWWEFEMIILERSCLRLIKFFAMRSFLFKFNLTIKNKLWMQSKYLLNLNVRHLSLKSLFKYAQFRIVHPLNENRKFIVQTICH